jgi:nucleoside-diphosphate-sugar epimerase
MSTVAVMSQVRYEPIDANHPVITARTGPLGAYGAAKVAIEAFAYAYEQSFGVDFRVIRPSALYGFGMSWAASNYVKQIIEPALQGQDVHLDSGGDVPRDYVHVADLAQLVLSVLRGPDDADRIFFAGTGQPLSTGGDVGKIVSELAPESQVVVGNGWTDEDRVEARIRGVIDVQTNLEQLGWRPQFVDLRSGLREYAERFRDFQRAGGVPSAIPATL